MSEENSTPVFKDAAIEKDRPHQFLGIYEIVIIVLIALSIIGIGITDFSPADSYKYWVAMVPIFCGACLILEWSRVRGRGFKWTTLLRTQLLHWVGLLVAVRLVFEMLHKGRLDNENTGQLKRRLVQLILRIGKPLRQWLKRIKCPKNNEGIQPRGWYHGRFIATLNNRNPKN